MATRQLVRSKDGKLRTAFFFPHDTVAAPCIPDQPEFQAELRSYAWNQLHWILGRNLFDTSMLMGSGHNNAAYMFFQSYKYTSAPGAVLNGITSALDDENGIAFNQGFAVTGKDEDWRWTEEWLPPCGVISLRNQPSALGRLLPRCFFAAKCACVRPRAGGVRFGAQG